MNFVEKLDAPPFIKDYFEDHASTDGLKAYYIRNEKSIGIYYKYYIKMCICLRESTSKNFFSRNACWCAPG